MNKKFKLMLGLTIIFAMLFVSACSGGGSSSGSNKTENFVVGVSNGFIGNGWRTQMIEDMEILGAEYKEKGWVDKIIIQHAGVDVNNQIAQIRNMINAKVDLLLINPNSPTALNPVISEAVKKGIMVISFDGPVTSDEVALNVIIDQELWGRNQGEYIADVLKGKGNIVMINGIAGHSVSLKRETGMKEALKGTDIKIVSEAAGNWDQAASQQAMSNLIASNPNLDGVLTQDGMALGVINAYQAANKPLPKITGETMVGFLRTWKELKDKDGFSTLAQNNPPGIGATALGLGIRLLQGEELKNDVAPDKTYIYPVKTFITNDNLEEYLDTHKDKPDTYFPDEWLDEAALDALFK